MNEDLKKLGLTDNEVKVYISLLHIGETPVGGIINDLKIHRQIAYNALDSLEKKNMVGKTTRNSIYHYKTTDPKIIVENIRKQELIAERLSKNIEAEQKKNKREHEVSVYNGKAQIRQFYLKEYKSVPENTEMFGIYTSGDQYKKVMGRKTLEEIEKMVKKKNISIKHITSVSFKEDMNKFIDDLDLKVREVKFLPNLMTNPVSTYVLHDCVIYQLFFSDEPFIIVIKNEDFRNSLVEYFNSVWESAKK